MTMMPQFDERWNIVYDSLGTLKMDIEPFTCYLLSQAIIIYIAFFIMFSLMHYLRTMWLPAVAIQYNGA